MVNKQSKLKDTLELHIDSGIDETIGKEPRNWFEQNKVDEKEVVTQKSYTNDKSPMAEIKPFSKPRTAKENAEQLVANVKSLEDLEKAVKSFDGCPLKDTAMNTVFSDGTPDADIMLIGEAPGADEDRQGLPFVGRSGQLLDRVFEAIGYDRKKLYITNIIPWRPPGNRTPTTAEMAMCLPFVLKHIEIMKPKVVVLLGGTAVKALLNRPEGIMKLRGKWHSLQPGDTPAMATFHPAYLLRSPGQKRHVWRDMLMIKDKLSQLKQES